MIAGSLEIQLMANMARLQKDMDAARRSVGGAMEHIERTVERAKMALGGFVAGLGIGQIISMVDQYTKFNAQLRLATDSASQYASAYAEVRRISKAAQADLAATGTLYARIATGTKELGLSQQQVAGVTEVVNLALKVSGATAEESSSAMLQLSQAFASGALRGEEFNAVNEAAPRLMKALADGLGVPVGALKEMATEGKLTSGVMVDSLLRALEQVRSESESIQTIGGAFTVLKNNIMEMVGTQAQASGAVSALTNGIGTLAKNLQLVAGVIATVTASKLAQWLSAGVAETYKSVAANQTKLAAVVAAAKADVAATEATIAQATATKAMIAVAREEALTKLASANASVVSAQAATQAATAAGAQSFALRTLAASTAELTKAEAVRSAELAALATLGRQQAAVTAQITAAQSALTAQSTALAAAQGAASIGGRALGGVLGLLGGPVGAVTTLLGLGATAWMLWGRNASEGAKQAKESVLDSSAAIIAELDKQIERNQRIIDLRKQGATAEQANKNERYLAEMARMNDEIAEIERGAGKYRQQNSTERFFEREKVMTRILDLAEKIQKQEQTGAQAMAATQNEKLGEFWKEYASNTQKATAEVEKWKKALGSAFTPELEKAIRDRFPDKEASKFIRDQESAAKSAREYIDSLNQETIQIGLNADQVKMLAAAREAAKAPTAELRMEIMQSALAHDMAAKAYDTKVEAEKRAAAAEAAALERSQQAISQAYDEVASLQAEIDAYEKLPAEITRAEIAKLQLLKTTLESNEGTEQEIRTTEALIIAKRKLAGLQDAKAELDRQKKVAAESEKIWDNFRENVQRNLGDVLYNGLMGKFDNIGDVFKAMLARMAADAAAANLSEAMFGAKGTTGGGWLGAAAKGLMALAGVPTYETGGYSGSQWSDGFAKGGAFHGGRLIPFANGGAFSNGIVSEPTLFPIAGGKAGLMGEAGEEAIMPLMRSADGSLGVRADGGGGTVVHISNAPVIHVDASAEKAEVERIVMRAVQRGNMQLTELWDREGVN